METQGTYNLSIQEAIMRDVRFSLFSTTADLIVSASFLFESKYAYILFERFKQLFVSRKFVIAITYDDLPKMITQKQELYRGKESLFPNYFNDLWHILIESNLIFVQKRTNTTLFIADKMTSDIYQSFNFESRKNIPYFIGTIEDRNGQAITHHLFDRTFNRLDVSVNDQSQINYIISATYIQSYLEFFDATIPTQLSCGIYKYDHLSKENDYYTSNISFWMRLYKHIGLFDFIVSCKVDIINSILESEEQIEFVRTIKQRIIDTIDKEYISNAWFSLIINQIPRCSRVGIDDIDNYFLRIKQITEILKEPKILNRRTIQMSINEKDRTVFVVYGRNIKIKNSVFQFLRALNIKPLEWETAARLTGKGTPSTIEIINAGMKNASGIIVIFTGDDKAILNKDYRKNSQENHYKMQPRPNVLVEAGMALALFPNSTVIIKIGDIREISDLSGINYIELSNDASARQRFVSRLSTTGLKLDTSGTDWLNAGDFSI